jgi:hypothetical protein
MTNEGNKNEQARAPTIHDHDFGTFIFLFFYVILSAQFGELSSISIHRSFDKKNTITHTKHQLGSSLHGIQVESVTSNMSDFFIRCKYRSSNFLP